MRTNTTEEQRERKELTDTIVPNLLYIDNYGKDLGELERQTRSSKPMPSGLWSTIRSSSTTERLSPFPPGHTVASPNGGTTRLTLAVAIILSASLTGQQVKHELTAAQCQADQRLWLDEAENSHTHLNFVNMDGWLMELHDCERVDSNNRFIYHNTESEVIAEQALRMESFIQRHGLWNKFINEDSAGKR